MNPDYYASGSEYLPNILGTNATTPTPVTVPKNLLNQDLAKYKVIQQYQI